MFDWLPELRPIEYSSIITGLCGLVFGGAQYRRAKTADTRAGSAEERAVSAEERARRAEAREHEADRKQLEIAAASEKDQALIEAHTVRAAFDLLQWKTFILRSAALALRDDEAVELCDANVKSIADLFSPYADIETVLKTVHVESSTHETIKVIKQYRTMLRRGIADKDLNERRVEDYLGEIKRGLEIRRSPR